MLADGRGSVKSSALVAEVATMTFQHARGRRDNNEIKYEVSYPKKRSKGKQEEISSGSSSSGGNSDSDGDDDGDGDDCSRFSLHPHSLPVFETEQEWISLRIVP